METTIRVRWMDATAGGSEGWYVEVSEGGRVATDSQKVSFPVDVDNYREDELDRLMRALLAEYPGAQIEED